MVQDADGLKVAAPPTTHASTTHEALAGLHLIAKLWLCAWRYAERRWIVCNHKGMLQAFVSLAEVKIG
jgi:hypothetical protein